MKYFKSISVKNFFSFGPQEQTLDLTGNGIWNIAAPNGVGKTSLCIESMNFAIYGKTRQEKIDDVINRQIGKNCKVSLEFVGDDDEDYKIIRYRKHDTHGNSVYLFKGDKDISCKNSRDTDALIQDYIGMPYIAFVNSTIFSSELYSNFLSAKNSERLEIFENILSLKEINTFYVETKEVLKEINEKEQEINLSYTAKETEKNTISKTIEDYNSNAKTKLLELKSEKENAKSEKEKIEEEIKELSVINVSEEKGKLSNSKLKTEYEEQLEKLNNKMLSIQELKFPSSSKELKEKYDNFDFKDNKEKELKAAEIDKEFLEYENSLKDEKSNIDNIKGKISNSDFRLRSNQKKKEELDNQMEKIKDSICPYCGQKMNEEETEKKKNTILEEEKTIEEEIKKYSNDKEILEKELEVSKEKCSKLEEKIKTKPVIEYIPNSDLIEEKYKNACSELENYNKKNEENNNIKSEIESDINTIKEKISKLDISKYSEDFLNSLEEQIENKNNRIIELNNIIATVDGSVKNVYDKDYVVGLNNSLKEKNKESEEIKKNLDKWEDDEKYYKYLSEIFSNKSGGFKKYFIGQMIDAFNEKVNQFLPFFFTDEKVTIEFSKELIDTIKWNGQIVSFNSLSCGQKVRAELAVAFSLFSVSRVFFANSSGLLIVDEMLDRGLDARGIKSALSVLEAFADDTKVLVVSHNPILKDELENVIELKKDENDFTSIVIK